MKRMGSAMSGVDEVEVPYGDVGLTIADVRIWITASI